MPGTLRTGPAPPPPPGPPPRTPFLPQTGGGAAQPVAGRPLGSRSGPLARCSQQKHCLLARERRRRPCHRSCRLARTGSWPGPAPGLRSSCGAGPRAAPGQMAAWPAAPTGAALPAPLLPPVIGARDLAGQAGIEGRGTRSSAAIWGLLGQRLEARGLSSDLVTAEARPSPCVPPLAHPPRAGLQLLLAVSWPARPSGPHGSARGPGSTLSSQVRRSARPGPRPT